MPDFLKFFQVVRHTPKTKNYKFMRTVLNSTVLGVAEHREKFEKKSKICV